jgi:hypothetical protein
LSQREPLRKRRLEAAIDACAVWAALFLTYVSVQRVLRLRGGDPEL